MGQFARLLPDRGWDVTVVTGRQPDAVAIDRDGERAIAERATILRAWSPAATVVKRGTPVAKHGLKGIARRAVRAAAVSVLFPDREVLWVPGAVAAGRQALRDQHHDAVLGTYGPPSNLVAAYMLASEAKLPLVIDFRDLYSMLPMPVFPTPMHRAAARKLEQTVVKRASRILAVAPAMAADLASAHGRPEHEAISITNGFDPRDVERVHDNRANAARPFRLIYTGSVNSYYNMEPLWKALRRLADDGTITPQTFRCEFVGNLSLDEVRRFELEEFVEVSPFVPHAEVFDAFARADALLMVEAAGYYARYSYAAKVFDYLLSGKPVVALVERDGNTDRLLRASGVGLCVDPNDVEALFAALGKVLDMKSKAPRPVDPTVPPLSEFNREQLVAKLAAILDEVVTSEPKGRW